jgi:predicted site-specific integrase-resolvase
MLSSMQMAKIIGVSKNKMIDLANAGAVPAIKLPSGHYRFDPQEVIDTLRNNAKVGGDDA